jgi:hypothetical protein
LQNLRQRGGLVDFPVLLRREADARTVGAAALVAMKRREISSQSGSMRMARMAMSAAVVIGA